MTAWPRPAPGVRGLRVAAALFAGTAAACGTPSFVTYTEDGELVRHHLGYVRVISPPAHAPDAAVRALEVSTYGVWVDVDRREGAKGDGSGAGLGVRFDRRDYLPKDCRLVIRVPSKEDIATVVALLNDQAKGEGLCIIRDSASAGQ